ncbi:MAG: ATPase [Pararhodobacter sp.]|nr:ATPase [Pararhodobacter sp.]
MSGWARKRFWKAAEVCEVENGFTVHLDGRNIKTPGKVPLVVPTAALAGLIADEWQAQGEKVAPETMPATRAANAAIDKVRGQFSEVAALVAAYGETDLLCYRAKSPAGLRARQDAAWDPLLDWSAAQFGLRWVVIEGVMPQPQPPETLEVLNAHVARFTEFELTAFHDLVAMSGSLVIGLAVTEAHAAPETLWPMSRIDEDWQREIWGEDDEARALAALRRQSFLNAARFFAALR